MLLLSSSVAAAQWTSLGRRLATSPPPLAVVEETLDRYRSHLLELPGTTAVGISLKRTDGRIVGYAPVITLFVRRKRRRVDHSLPPLLDGVRTDVVEREFRFRATATDPHQRFDSMFSGLAITSEEDPTTNGSIGCFIRTTGKLAGGGHPAIAAGVYLLTNHHVLQVAGANAPHGNIRIIQPEYPNYNPFNNPVPNHYRCANWVDGYRGATDDCAIASLAFGRSWSNSVPAAPWWPGSRWFGGTSAAVLHSNVYKFGATTRYTTARIHTIGFAAANVAGAIYCENAQHDTWVAGGDSGSVCVYPYSNNIVGLNFQEDSNAAANNGVGCYGGLAYPILTQMNNFVDVGGTVTIPWF